MKNLFLSPERIVFRSYQRELVFRAVGLIVLVTGLLQLPVLFFAFTTWQNYQTLTDKKVQLAAAANELQTKLVVFKETRQKLDVGITLLKEEAAKKGDKAELERLIATQTKMLENDRLPNDATVTDILDRVQKRLWPGNVPQRSRTPRPPVA